MPGLQFNNISLGVAHVAERQAAGGGDVEGDDLAVIASAGGQDFGALFLDVGNFEGDVSETGARDFRTLRGFGGFELENFESGTVFAVAREAQMTASGVRRWTGGQGFELGAVMIAFAADRDAIEEALVEISEAFPIAGDEVGVGVSNGGLQGAISGLVGRASKEKGHEQTPRRDNTCAY